MKIKQIFVNASSAFADEYINIHKNQRKIFLQRDLNTRLLKLELQSKVIIYTSNFLQNYYLV
jgi:hypothetical protein